MATEKTGEGEPSRRADCEMLNDYANLLSEIFAFHSIARRATFPWKNLFLPAPGSPFSPLPPSLSGNSKAPEIALLKRSRRLPRDLSAPSIIVELSTSFDFLSPSSEGLSGARLEEIGSEASQKIEDA